MAIDYFKPTFRTFKNPVDLDVLSKTYDTLEKGHQKAIATASTIETELAKLDLNEEEDLWRQQQIDKIKSALTDNMKYGNAYSSLDDITKVYGDITSNAGMIGRLKAQQDYKAYLENLNSRTDLPEADKEYFREKNKYEYSDIIQNGKVIGGTKWTPKEQEVSTPDVVKLELAALKIAAKDSGGSTTIFYKDANGNYTENSSLSIDGLPYYSINGEFEELDKNKIQEALNNVISNTPGAYEGLQQDFKIDKWRYDKEKQKRIKNNDENPIIDNTTDDKGIELNFEQYLDKRFKGFYHSATYSNYYSDIRPLAGMSVTAGKNEAAINNSKKTPQEILSTSITDAKVTTPGGYRIDKVSSISGEIGKYYGAIETFKGIANKLQIKFNSDDIEETYNNIKKYYDDKGEVIPKNIYDTYNSYLKSVSYISQFDELVNDKDIKQKIEFTSSLENGIDLSNLKDNKYANKYIDIINQMYHNRNEFPIYLNGNFDETIRNFPDYADYGLKVKIDNEGKKYLSLSKENANNLYIISNLTKGLTNGGIEEIIKKQAMDNPDIIPTYLEDIRKLYNEAAESIDYSNMGGTQLIPSELVSENDVTVLMAQDLVNSGKYSDLKSATEIARKNIIDSVLNGYGPRYNMAISDGINPATFNNTGRQRNAAMQIVKRLMAIDKDLCSISFDKETLNTHITCTLPDDFIKKDDIKEYLKILDNDGYQLNLVIENMVNNETKNALMNSLPIKSAKEFNQLTNAGASKIYNADGSTIIIENGNYGLLSDDGLLAKPITRNEAKNIYLGNNIYNELKYKYMEVKNYYKGDIPINVLTSFGDRILDLTKYYSEEDSEATTEAELSSNGKYIYRNLINNIINNK